MELPKIPAQYGPRAFYLLQEYFNKYKKTLETFYNNISFVNIGIANLKMFETLGTNILEHRKNTKSQNLQMAEYKIAFKNERWEIINGNEQYANSFRICYSLNMPLAYRVLTWI